MLMVMAMYASMFSHGAFGLDAGGRALAFRLEVPNWTGMAMENTLKPAPSFGRLTVGGMAK